eukprot:5645872-Pyramimonas_sp.AAC.1
MGARALWGADDMQTPAARLTVRRARVEILRANEKMEEFGGALRWISACEHMSDRPAKLRVRQQTAEKLRGWPTR